MEQNRPFRTPQTSFRFVFDGLTWCIILFGDILHEPFSNAEFCVNKSSMEHSSKEINLKFFFVERMLEAIFGLIHSSAARD